MAAVPDDPTALLAAYRRAIWKLIGLAVFAAICLAIVFFARRMFKLPPALLTLPLIAALILFGADLWHFFRLRNAVQRMRESAP